VEVRQLRDPIAGHLEDARALIKTEGLPRDVAARVVPGFCRLALEAACMDTIRRRRLTRGAAHAEVEALLNEHASPYPLMALALVDDAVKTNDVLPRLAKVGAWAPDAFKACNVGGHGAHEGDLRGLVSDTEKLTQHLARLGA
jgi:hypothetical protein